MPYCRTLGSDVDKELEHLLYPLAVFGMLNSFNKPVITNVFHC